jgi:hypothetical protein
MGLLNATRPTTAGVNPVSNTPTATDTISAADLARGAYLHAVTTGTASNVTVADPGKTPSSNPGTTTPVVCSATGRKVIYIPPSAVDPNAGQATVTSSSQTGLTYELYPL